MSKHAAILLIFLNNSIVNKIENQRIIISKKASGGFFNPKNIIDQSVFKIS